MKTTKHTMSRIMPCLILYVTSFLLMTWRLWLPEYIKEESFWGYSVLKTTLIILGVFTAIFVMLIRLKLNFFNSIRVNSGKLLSSKLGFAVILPVSIILFSFLFKLLFSLLPDGFYAANRSAYNCCIGLTCVMLAAKGQEDSDQIIGIYKFRLAVVPILVVLSKALLHGFAPALYLCLMATIIDILSAWASGEKQQRLRNSILLLTPIIICVILIVAGKALLYSEILSFQLRSMIGQANSYSLGAYIDCLRASGLWGVVCCIFYLGLLLSAPVLVTHFLRSKADRFRVLFFGVTATVFAVFGIIQAYLYAVIATAFMPFCWMIAGGMVALLANSIAQSEYILAFPKRKTIKGKED